ncbi:MAG: hypothetical protein KGJ57_17580 [Sphingomonadales bacterium]|nr:hypothetical protein [Sphingomonadales bacterium]MDE2171210.1 hypothetical protein [Sphingomonadales bacterium]
MAGGAFTPTARQAEMLRFVHGYQLAHGVSPSYVEIAAALSVASKSNVHRLMTGCEERGLIQRLGGHQRAIRLLVDVAVPRAPDGAPLYFVPAGALPGASVSRHCHAADIDRKGERDHA